MSLAIPLTEGRLAVHFHRCQEFALVDVDPYTGIVQKRRSAAVPPAEAVAVPQWLADQGAQVLIVGSMGERERGLFADRGIRTILGAPPRRRPANWWPPTSRAVCGAKKTAVTGERKRGTPGADTAPTREALSMTMRRDERRRSPTGPTRRRFLTGAAGTAGSLLVGSGALAEAPAGVDPAAAALKEGIRLQIDGDSQALIQKAYDLGHRYEGKYGNCCQCTLAALQDALPFVPKDVNLFRAGCGLDGGSTPVGVQNCGSFTGAAMILGYLTGRWRDENRFIGGTRLAHRLTHRLYARYKEHYGTVLCQDVRKSVGGNCPEVVGRAARWATEILIEEFGSA